MVLMHMKNHFRSLIVMVGQYQVVIMLSEKPTKQKNKTLCIETAYFQAGIRQADLDQSVFTRRLRSKKTKQPKKC